MKLGLYSRSVAINDRISIKVPTVGEIIDDVDNYLLTATLFTSMPIDLMVQLDDMGIDFTEIDEWQLFALLFPIIRERDASMIFDGLDLRNFVPAPNPENGELIFKDQNTGVVIDRLTHYQIANTLRKILFLTKNTKRPGNQEAKEYLLYKERKRMKRAARKQKNGDDESQLETIIVSLVNREEFPYNYETVKDITVYQFYKSFYQIIHKVNYDNLMTGCYAGTVDTTKINKKELTWLDFKD